MWQVSILALFIRHHFWYGYIYTRRYFCPSNHHFYRSVCIAYQQPKSILLHSQLAEENLIAPPPKKRLDWLPEENLRKPSKCAFWRHNWPISWKPPKTQRGISLLVLPGNFAQLCQFACKNRKDTKERMKGKEKISNSIDNFGSPRVRIEKIRRK